MAKYISKNDEPLTGFSATDYFTAPLWQELADEDYTFLKLGQGGVMERAYWEDLKERVDAFYATFSDEEIYRINNPPPRMIQAPLLRVVPPPPAPKAGYIYLFHGVGTIWYKIGFSIRPQMRRSQVEGQNPFLCEEIHRVAVDDMVGMETALHRHFGDRLANREWFTLTEADVAFFKGLTKETAAQWLEQKRKEGNIL